MSRSIRKTPFEVVTGMHPRGISELRDISSDDRRSSKAEDFADHMATLYIQVKQHLEDVNNKYKEKADEKRRHKEFEVGNEVLLYLRKERFPVGTYNKLQMKKFGPCKILRKFSSRNAYEVELPDSLSISSVFNIVDLHQHHEPEFSEDSVAN